MTAQRNDPCPCGSGKKYKKCCMKKEQASKRLSLSTSNVEDVVTPQTIPYFFLKSWKAARERGDFALLYAMLHEDGPYRASFDSPEDFYTKAQQQPLPGAPELVLTRIKLDEKEALLLSTRGFDDARTAQVQLEFMRLRKTALGWRVFEVRAEQLTKTDELSPDTGFEVFGVDSLAEQHYARVRDGFEREDLADRPPEPEEEDDDSTEGVDDVSDESSASSDESPDEERAEAGSE